MAKITAETEVDVLDETPSMTLLIHAAKFDFSLNKWKDLFGVVFLRLKMNNQAGVTALHASQGTLLKILL